MFLIKAYRWTLTRLHTALTAAADRKFEEAEKTRAVIKALHAKQLTLQTESANLDAEAARLKVLLG